MPTKAPIKTQTLMAHVVISQLQAEAKLERALSRFSADDDEPRVPCPLDSAQSRRSVVGAL